ncbi:MAG: hypothetical protein KDA52_00215 [Planctomycetaceae bacterium]|nr:hypothetical protein [Planctomycetaceae bacterium]
MHKRLSLDINSPKYLGIVQACKLIAGILTVNVAVGFGAEYRSNNYLVEASTPQIASVVASEAEAWRSAFAKDWLGSELETWSVRCCIIVDEQKPKPGGLTSYVVDDGQATEFRMTIYGPLGEMLETVLPHEVSHAVLASYLGQIIPRWADEGIALMSESMSVRKRQRLLAREIIESKEAPSLRTVLSTLDYPADHNRVLEFYAHSHSLTEFLVKRGSKRRLIQFLEDCPDRAWDEAVRHHYAFPNVEAMEVAWRDWVNRSS